MKDKRFLFGLLVITLAFAMTVAGCENDLIPDPKLNGTWVYEYSDGRSQTLKFNNGSYEISITSSTGGFSGPHEKGTYTTGSGLINWSGVQINGAHYASIEGFEDKWYSLKEYKEVMKSAGFETYTTGTPTYQVSGNTLTLTATTTKDSDGSVEESSSTWTKR